MFFGNILKTLFSKGIILILNFLLVVITTNLWGSEGRGLISIIMADMAIVLIFNNLLGGSCIVYFTQKLGEEKLIMPAYIWITLSSIIGSLIFFMFQPQVSLIFLLFTSILNSLLAINLGIIAAKENFTVFNISSILLPLLSIIFIFFVKNVIGITSNSAYFIGYISALLVVWLVTLITIKKYVRGKRIQFSWPAIKQMVSYGWQTELSYLIHFVNFRLSYFLILYFLGLKAVGLYSVGIALSESIWMVVNSISTVLYSRIVNNSNREHDINLTKESAKISLYFSVFIAALLCILPSELFQFVFGKEFYGVKGILFCLLPGTIAIAFSNIHGHFFSATANTKPLIIKSLLGLIVTLGLSPVFIQKYGIAGAGITTSLSYLVSTIYLIILFYHNTKFSFNDLIFRIPKLK